MCFNHHFKVIIKIIDTIIKTDANTSIMFSHQKYQSDTIFFTIL